MIKKDNLLEWLKELDNKLDKKIILIAVGGTAMTLLGLKSSTRDVDFCIQGKDFLTFRKLSEKSKFKVDLFQDGFIFSEQLPVDYIDKSNKLETELMNIDLRILSLVDIIITKVARYDERDEEDIATIAKTVNKNELENRFNEVKETFVGNRKDYIYHFNLVLKRHF